MTNLNDAGPGALRAALASSRPRIEPPNNASDRNGTELSAEGYTNLEVYLNGYYAETPLFATKPLLEAGLSIEPNPFSDATTIRLLRNAHATAEAQMFGADKLFGPNASTATTGNPIKHNARPSAR